MDCPDCGKVTRVLESRRAEGGASLRRRRRCTGCDARFTTFERLAASPPAVIKRGGERQRFDARKLRDALVRATHKRDVERTELEALIHRIEREASETGEITAERIGDLCLEGLAAIDDGAFMQFAGTLPGPGRRDPGNTRKHGRTGASGSVRVQEDADRPNPQRTSSE